MRTKEEFLAAAQRLRKLQDIVNKPKAAAAHDNPPAVEACQGWTSVREPFRELRCNSGPEIEQHGRPSHSNVWSTDAYDRPSTKAKQLKPMKHPKKVLTRQASRKQRAMAAAYCPEPETGDRRMLGTAVLAACEMGLEDFSVTSIRSLYKLRRSHEDDVERERHRAEHGIHDSRLRHMTAAEQRRAATVPHNTRSPDRTLRRSMRATTAPINISAAAPHPLVSLERQLAVAGARFTIINGVTSRRLCMDLFYKLQLLQDVRSALRNRSSVLLRAPLAENEESENECRQALRSVYMSCVDQCRDPAVPPLNLDASCRCYELLMEPKHIRHDDGRR